MMPPTARALWLPKAGSAPEQYEDAFALEPAETGAPVRAAAVADGATETVFARAWARLLADSLAASPRTSEWLAQALPVLRRAWAAEIAGDLARAPWYLVEKAEQGAGATLLGLRVRPGGRWRALAVGDACLFHLRREEAEAVGGGGAETTGRRYRVAATWPFGEADAFDDRPDLLMSRADTPGPTPLVAEGAWQPGDVFLLVTDALAAFLLGTDRAPEAVAWTPEWFAEVVAEARRDGSLRNDDVTLVVLPAR